MTGTPAAWVRAAREKSKKRTRRVAYRDCCGTVNTTMDEPKTVFESLNDVPSDAGEVWAYVSDRYGDTPCWTTDPAAFVAEFCDGEPERPALTLDRYDVDGETVLERVR